MTVKTTTAVSLVTAFLMAAVSAGRGDAVNASLPHRKPGHWQLTSISAEVGMSTIDACIGPDDSIAAPQEGRTCKEAEVQQAGDQVIVNVTCTSVLGEERFSTLFTGDFQTWYRAITKITFDPPTNGVDHMAVTVDAKYIGPYCVAAPR